MQKLQTTRRQRISVGYFRKYTVDENQIAIHAEREERRKRKLEHQSNAEIEEEERQVLEAEKELVIEGCKPRENMTDRRILFEMTGRRLNAEDFPADEESE